MCLRVKAFAAKELFLPLSLTSGRLCSDDVAMEERNGAATIIIYLPSSLILISRVSHCASFSSSSLIDFTPSERSALTVGGMWNKILF